MIRSHMITHILGVAADLRHLDVQEEALNENSLDVCSVHTMIRSHMITHILGVAADLRHLDVQEDCHQNNTLRFMYFII